MMDVNMYENPKESRKDLLALADKCLRKRNI